MPPPPSWDTLFALADPQAGHFTTRQAGAIGYSPQLLQKHVTAGRLRRVRRGVYRLAHYPRGEHEALVSVWLWADGAGVFSHETALAGHGLAEVLPARVHLTVSPAWRRRRVTVPEGVVLHYAVVGEDARGWLGPVPLTTAARALNDCAREGLAPDLLLWAVEQALHRGLATRGELPDVAKVLEPYGGIPRVDSDRLVTRGVVAGAGGAAASGPDPGAPPPAAGG